MDKRAAKSRRERRIARRRQRLVARSIILSSVLLCAAGLFLLSASNGRAPADAWYVEGEAVEVAAPPVEGGFSTLDERDTALRTLPFFPATQPPAELPIPTRVPLPTHAPLPTFAPQPTADVPEARGPVTIVISAAGDCTLGGDYGSSAVRRFQLCAEQNGADYFLENVRGIFAADDFTVINLEGPLTTGTAKRPNRPFNFRGRPEYVEILSGSSVEVATLANNHALDFGKEGLLETAQLLTDAGIGAAGYANAHYAEKDGVRLCFLGFTEWDYTAKQIASIVSRERGNCDLLIVSMHWGRELVAAATGTQKTYGRAIVDAGADLVLGHHPHVVGGIEKYKGKYIVYSLGNFCFGGNTNPRDKDTMIFQQTFAFDFESGIADAGINIIPCTISSVSSTNNYQPTPLAGANALRVLEEVASHSPLKMSDILWMDGFIGNADRSAL
ncbi:MAG: CapA family protein [Clostridiales bacterium]|jgi:poly-gamma-glutamate capsule biosynthesis protein CapA/YwtB (metallophosphatase superfamily)|nr:CapA family protein [Clostridiales bacterium]